MGIRSLCYKLCIVASCSVAFADSSNTQTGDLNTNQQAGGDISTNSGTVINQTTGSSKPSPPPSSIAPSYMSSGQDTCLIGLSGGAQTAIIGLSAGSYRRDEFCEKLKLSKVLYDQGMKIGALTILCNDSRVFEAMFEAGTPCPITVKGKTYIGKMAYIYWERYPEKRPNYSQRIHGDPSWERELTQELNNEASSDTRTMSERFRSTLRNP
jgi:hypothetical protein